MLARLRIVCKLLSVKKRETIYYYDIYMNRSSKLYLARVFSFVTEWINCMQTRDLKDLIFMRLSSRRIISLFFNAQG